MGNRKRCLNLFKIYPRSWGPFGVGVRFWGRMWTPTHFHSLLLTATHSLSPSTPHPPLPPLPAPPPPVPHTPCCCCYAAERTSFSRAARFRAGTRAKRSTPRKLRGKLRGSSAHPQLRSKLQKLLRTLVVQFNVSSL